MAIAYLDGAFVPEEQAAIPVADRGVLCGDGVTTTIKVDEGIPLFLDEHLRRLRTQCHKVRILFPESLTADTVYELITYHPPTPVMRLRLFITGGETSAIDLPTRQGHVAMRITPYLDPIPSQLRMACFSYPFSLVHAQIKTLANFNRFWIVDEARARGFDDGYSISPEGYLLEGAFGNLFWIEGAHLYTPHPTLPYYFGVTLTQLVRAPLRWEVHYVQKQLKELPPTAALFRSSTLGGIVPIIQLEERLFPECKSLTQELQNLWSHLVTQERAQQINERSTLQGAAGSR